MTVDQREELHDEELIDNPDVADKVEWMKERLDLETNEELFSKALSLLHQMIELEDKGFSVGAWKDSLLSRKVLKYRITPRD
jgi:L-fucose isomerase-like protein